MNTNEHQSKRTPLYDSHARLGAKFVPFAGWEMPVQYSGLVEEHQAVREAAGLFDVSHMGEILVTGPEAETVLNELTCNDVRTLEIGRAQYSALTNEQGGVVDDIIIYKRGPEEFFLCVNASNREWDYQWLAERNQRNAQIADVSDAYAQFALQGPLAESILQPLTDVVLPELGYFSMAEGAMLRHRVLIARTGYTGEDGFEIFIPLDGGGEAAVELWDLLLEAGKPKGMLPVGLGARDTLRLEACLPLHGHELGEDITAIESGLGWIVKPGKGEFPGRAVLADQKRKGAPRKLIGFEIEDRGIGRHGDLVLSSEGVQIGLVTSGTRTPTLGRSVGLALVDRNHTEIGTELLVEVRGRRLRSKVVERPFYKRKG